MYASLVLGRASVDSLLCQTSAVITLESCSNATWTLKAATTLVNLGASPVTVRLFVRFCAFPHVFFFLFTQSTAVAPSGMTRVVLTGSLPDPFFVSVDGPIGATFRIAAYSDASTALYVRGDAPSIAWATESSLTIQFHSARPILGARAYYTTADLPVRSACYCEKNGIADAALANVTLYAVVLPIASPR